MAQIVDVHFPKLKKRPAVRGTERVLRRARRPGPEEEAVDVRAARLDQAAARRGHSAGGAAGDDKRKAIPPLYGALLKNEQDVHLFERLAFLDRRSRQ